VNFPSASGAGAAQAAIRTDNANTKTKQLLTTNVNNFFLFNLILLIKQNLNVRLFHTSSFIVSPPHISFKITFEDQFVSNLNSALRPCQIGAVALVSLSLRAGLTAASSGLSPSIISTPRNLPQL